jgi:ribosomal protein S18 acetylase RimI-like enzyme
MSEEFAYRPATAKDARCLSVLASQVFLDTYATNGINGDLASEVTTVLSEHALLDRLARGTVELFVAERNGNMIGYLDLDLASLSPNPEAQGVEVFRLYVQRPFQRMKVGRSFMTLAEQRARALRRSGVWLTAWVGNHRARAFYAALGYRDVGATQYIIEGKAYENRVLCKALLAGAG